MTSYSPSRVLPMVFIGFVFFFLIVRNWVSKKKKKNTVGIVRSLRTSLSFDGIIVF